ncbi:DUF4126 domain-containing protein, partial [Xanthomonas oryzae pv. oryzae]
MQLFARNHAMSDAHLFVIGILLA